MAASINSGWRKHRNSRIVIGKNLAVSAQRKTLAAKNDGGGANETLTAASNKIRRGSGKRGAAEIALWRVTATKRGVTNICMISTWRRGAA